MYHCSFFGELVDMSFKEPVDINEVKSAEGLINHQKFNELTAAQLA